jgi:RNA polymerase sigma-70 factor (ECF subfamily)
VIRAARQRSVLADASARGGEGNVMTDGTRDAGHVPGAAPRRVGEEHRGAIQRFLRSQCGDAHALEDLVQETLLRGMRSADRLREAGSLSRWLMRIAWNVALDWRRRRVRRHEVSVDPEEHEIASEAHDVDPLERAERVGLRERWRVALRRALRGLQPRDRILVIGHYFVGFSCAELAARSGLTRANVKVRLCRSRRALRRLLPDGFELSEVRPDDAPGPRRRWPLVRLEQASDRDDPWAEAV